jgi:hypothetical protein
MAINQLYKDETTCTENGDRLYGEKKHGNLTFFMFLFPLLVPETFKESLHLKNLCRIKNIKINQIVY